MRGVIVTAVGVGLVLLLGEARAQVAVCIDPGHGGADPGAVGNGLEEADLNLGAALAFRDWLALDTADSRGGGAWEILMTREDDSEVSLAGRCDYANGAGADYFMSIHANAGGGDGTETYAASSGTTAATLAGYVQTEVLAALGTFDRGVKYRGFYVLANTAMPADLNEMAFIDVWDGNAALLADPENLDAVGLAHLHAIQRMVGLEPYTPSDGPPPEPAGTVAFADVPASIAADEPFSVTVAYETNLHAHGLVGQIAVEMRDGESWEVLAELVWDNDGSGVQGPAGERTFSFFAPADVPEVFFVAYITLLGQGWDERLGDVSSLDSPTTVEGLTEPPPGPDPWVGITDRPEEVARGTDFDVEVTWAPGELEADTELAVRLEVLDQRGGAPADRWELDVEVGDSPEGGSVDFSASYDGEAATIWLRACIVDPDDEGGCLAEDDTEDRPITVTGPSIPPSDPHTASCSGRCSAAAHPSHDAALGALVLLAPLLLRRRSSS